MTSNYTQFIHAFNELQGALEKKVNSSKNASFSDLIKNSPDKVVRNYKEELDFLRKFRNLLVHDTTDGSGPVAEPSLSIIKMVESLTFKINHPKKVNDLFHTKVDSFNASDPLLFVLRDIYKNNYSQFPVFDQGQLIGIVSENGITNYLATHAEEDLISINETTLSDILAVDDTKKMFQVVKQNKSIYEVEGIFSNKVKSGTTNFVILISQRGVINTPEDITGIITPWDLPKVIDNM